jgi:putative heme iron utilization protein
VSQSPNLNTVMDECRKFPGHFKSLHLATCNITGEPEASYAPYIEHEGSYYVYTSELSTHTANLAANGCCSVLFIESEAQARHLFARRRLTLQCTAIECHRDSPLFEPLMDMFVQKFGSFMEMMRKLADFHLYQLQPKSGSYVAGFAQAYALEGDGLREIKHRKEQGHRSPDKATATAMGTVTQ